MTSTRVEAERIARSHGANEEGFVVFDPAELIDVIDKALQAERERCAKALCKWCRDPAYSNLLFHHGEWRHYRADMHVEYCNAAAIRKADDE